MVSSVDGLGAEEGLQTEPLRHAVDPRVVAVGLAAVRTATQGLQLAFVGIAPETEVLRRMQEAADKR